MYIYGSIVRADKHFIYSEIYLYSVYIFSNHVYRSLFL